MAKGGALLLMTARSPGPLPAPGPTPAPDSTPVNGRDTFRHGLYGSALARWEAGSETMKTMTITFGAFAIVLLSTVAHAEIVLNCHGTQTSFGPTWGNSVPEEIANFGFIVNLERKEVKWATKFVGDATLPITTAGGIEISFGHKGWNSDATSFSPEPLPDANSHYTEYGKLNRLTGDLEYLSQTTWD